MSHYLSNRGGLYYSKPSMELVQDTTIDIFNLTNAY